MKVFRKKLYMKDRNRTEEQCEKSGWPVWCDGAQVSNSDMQDKDGHVFKADASWCEEVTSLDCQSDIDSMKDWPIGTEHVVRMNGKDVRVAVCSVHTSNMLDYKGCNDCALQGPCGGKVPCCAYERTNKDPVYFEHAEAQKSTDKGLVLKMHFSPEYNITFTEHNVNPDVGFETGKYYRFIGKKAIGLMHLSEMLKVLDNKVHKCTNGTGRSANFEGIGDDFNSVMFTWINKGFESEEFKYWKEMRPLVVMQAPDIITFDELCTFNGGSITGELPSSFSGLFDALTGREKVEQNIKEKTKMKVDKHFAFKKKFFGTTLHEPKVVKTHKTYANDGACEACGAIINSGDFVLTANETDCNKVTKKTHRLCASCTAEYLKAKSCVDIKSHKSYIEEFEAFVRENNVKEGTRIRITKDYGQDFNAGTYGHTGVAGRCGTVCYVGMSYINVRMDGEKMCQWSVPYYAMEVIKESNRTYKPITRFETGKWYVCHFKKRPHSWNIDGKMDGLLDGKPHKCTFGRWVYAEFEDIPSNGCGGWRFGGQLGYFEEVPEPVKSYSERQAEWVKENNVKEGTKVRVTRTFTEDEDGSCCWKHDDLVGMTGTVDEYGIASHNLGITMSDGNPRAIPYFVLEVVNEHTYEERQAEWVAKNNVKVGTKVRFTKDFKADEDGSGCCEHRDAKGKEGFVRAIEDEFLLVCIPSDSWAVPFTALEIVPEEPWFKLGDKVRITIKSSEAYNKIGTVTNISMHKDGTQTVYMSFEAYCGTKAFNADSKEKIGVLYTPTYEERQAEWIKKHNLKEGDKIAILRTAKADENGWENSWNESMTKMVGHVFEYREEHWDGIKLSCGYRWPYFVLGVVKE